MIQALHESSNQSHEGQQLDSSPSLTGTDHTTLDVFEVSIDVSLSDKQPKKAKKPKSYSNNSLLVNKRVKLYWIPVEKPLRIIRHEKPRPSAECLEIWWSWNPYFMTYLHLIYLDYKLQENNKRPYMRWVKLSGELIIDMKLKSAITTQLNQTRFRLDKSRRQASL